MYTKERGEQRMTLNFVFFGPTHSGKSTMAGYLLVNKGPQLYFDLFERIKQEIKNERKPNEKKYAWVVDTSRDERKRSTEIQPKKGSSIYMHAWPLDIDIGEIIECNLIDTPGFDAYTRERIKGIFWGDIGIFVAECKDLNKDVFDAPDNSIRDYLNPLILWSKMGPKKTPRLIVALSKMDLQEFSEKEYEKAKSKIELICQGINLTNVQIVPISINFDTEIDQNIIKKSPLMNWYNGPTLFETMEDQLKEVKNTKEIKKNLLLTLNDATVNIKGLGDIVEGKILSGRINIHDDVRIIPIEKAGQIASLEGKVKSIKIQHGPKVLGADEGSLVGVALSDQTINRKRCELSTCSLYTTSLLVYDNTQVKIGNILRLRFFNQDQEIQDYHTNQSVHIIWHGRDVTARVISFDKMDEKTEVVICLEKDIAAIPLNEGNNFCFKNFILKVNQEELPKKDNEGNPKITQEIVRTTIVDFGFLEGLEFTLTEPISDTKNLLSYFINYNKKINKNKVEFFGFSSPKKIFENLSRAKRFEEKKCKGANLIYKSMIVKIKENVI